MRKLIIKTVIITLSAIILLCSLLFGAFVLFSPKIIGDISKKFGNNKTACWAYEKQYVKDKSEDSFDILNEIYINYAIDLINDGEYEKATDTIINYSVDGRKLDKETFNVIKAKLLINKETASESNKIIIQNCIEKIDNKLN